MENSNGFRVLNDDDIEQFLSEKNKYRVIKDEDVEHYLSDKERFALNHLQAVIALGRESDNKTNTDKYLVVNTNVPYVDKIITIIEQADDLTPTEAFINRQVDYYLDDSQANLTPKEVRQLKLAMLYSVTGGSTNESFQFNSETFRFNIDLAITTIKENRPHPK